MSQYTLVCTEFESSTSTCLEEQWVEVYLIPPESETGAELFLTGGFSQEAAAIGFGGVIALFITGLTVGFSIKYIRRI